MIRKHAIVRGAVQGVGFRHATRERATRLGLSGFVRNLTDGTVEVEAEGPESELDALLTWLSEGPGTAVVDSVQVEDREPLGQAGFAIEF